MKLGLTVKLKQTLAPQLIQSLKMLQMPILKLEQTLRQELSTNPLLEEVEVQETKDETETAETQEEEEVDPQLGKVDWADYLGDENEFEYHPQRENQEERQNTTPVVERTLYDHLLEQLNFNKLTEEEFQIGEFIIGNIDGSGYLTCSVEEMANCLKTDQKQVQKILSLIQTFDPPGVGARDLKESLLIQLEGKHFEQSLAYQIVKFHLHELDKKSHGQLAKVLRVSVEEIQIAMDEIKSLSPKPALGRFTTAAISIVPDLVVERVGDELLVLHNDKNVPRLRINPAYRELIRKDAKSSKETKSYIKEKLEQARWFLNAINQRRSTMVNVMEVIVEEQKEFFEHGISHLKPLTMEAVAERVGMNVATISRVANDKYVQTPQGVFEIRYFFNTGVQGKNGEELSKRNVKRMVEDIIKAEDPSSPLSDQEIFERLRKEGIHIARRTVTKYREELKILPARFRKRVVSPKKDEQNSADLLSTSSPDVT